MIYNDIYYAYIKYGIKFNKSKNGTLWKNFIIEKYYYYKDKEGPF